MKLDEMIDITAKGTALLGDEVSCDGFRIDRPWRIQSHTHMDHMVDFGSSLGNQDVLIWRNESEYTFNWEGRLKLTLEATSNRTYKRTLLFAYEEVKNWDFFVVINDFRDDNALGEQVVRSFFLKFIYHW